MAMDTRFRVAPDTSGADDTHQPINGTLHAKIITKGSVQKQAGYQENGQRGTTDP